MDLLKIDKLPIEIIKKIILYNDINILYIINIYNTSKFFRNIIKKDIINYFKLTISSRKRHYLYDIIPDRLQWALYYYTEINEKDFNQFNKKKKILKIIKKFDYIRDIFKFINREVLKCNYCSYIYFENNFDRNIYKCINCEYIYCQECCFPCENNSCYQFYNKNTMFHHCINCRSKCFKNILLKSEKLSFEKDKEEINKLKSIIFNTYVKTSYRHDINFPEYCYDGGYIDYYLNYDPKIKNILKNIEGDFNSEYWKYLLNRR